MEKEKEYLKGMTEEIQGFLGLNDKEFCIFFNIEENELVEWKKHKDMSRYKEIPERALAIPRIYLLLNSESFSQKMPWELQSLMISEVVEFEGKSYRLSEYLMEIQVAKDKDFFKRIDELSKKYSKKKSISNLRH
mgnify:CR=1 FL=1|tara:strand:+ start:4365 stop:4769 length:405 start_codon:yes stop_codon:yes gene_type:complete